MPTVAVRANGNLATQLSWEQKTVSVDPGTTLETLLSELGLGARYFVVILNNTVSMGRNEELKEGDQIVIYSQMAGG